MPGLDGEGGADFASNFGADRDVLQVRIRGREAPGRGAGLIEGGVQASGRRAQERRQRVDVGRFQFRELAVFQHQPRRLMFGGQAFQHVHGGRDGFTLAVLHGLRQIQPVEQNVAQLAWRVDVEFRAAQQS